MTAREKTFGCGKKTFGSRDEKSRDTRKSKTIYAEFDRPIDPSERGGSVGSPVNDTRSAFTSRSRGFNSAQKIPPASRSRLGQSKRRAARNSSSRGRKNPRARAREVIPAPFPSPGTRPKARGFRSAFSARRRGRAAARPRAALRVWRDARDRQVKATDDDPPPLGSIVAVGSRARPRRLRAPSRPRASEPDRQKRDRAPPPPLSDSARVPRTDRPRLRPSNAPVQNNENLQTRTQKPLEQEDVRPHAVRRRRARARRRQGPGPRPQGSLRGRREG